MILVLQNIPEWIPDRLNLKLVESMLEYTLANIYQIFYNMLPFDQTLFVLVDVHHIIVYSNNNEISMLKSILNNREIT